MKPELPMILAFIAALASAPAEAAVPSPWGRWVLTAEGRPLIIVDARPCRPRAKACGSLIRPASFRISPTRAFAGVAGPARRLPIVSAVAKDGVLELSVAGLRQDRPADRFEIRPLDEDTASLSLVGLPMAPFALKRASADETVAARWDSSESYRVDEHLADEPLLARLFEEDQSARQGRQAPDSTERQRDAARRADARQLLESGRVRTGLDFERAAFLFQHGDDPADYLLAHSLAMAAIAKGRETALWIASASMDRYLLATGRPQVFGTQRSGNARALPADDKLIPKAVKEALGVAD